MATVPGALAGEYHDADFCWQEHANSARADLARKHADTGQPRTRKYVQGATSSWEAFHRTHSTAQFYKQRRYLPLAFPELLDGCVRHVVELGCGGGASIIPVLKANDWCLATVCDVSATAMAALASCLEAAGISQQRVHRFVADAAGGPAAPQLAAAARRDADVCLLVFMLSAVPKEHMSAVLATAQACLRPGGLLLLRDYGLFDMTHLRFPYEQRIGDATFLRQDGTLAHFFSTEEVQQLCEEAGFTCEAVRYACVKGTNRRHGLEMRRVYVHATLRKPCDAG